MRTGPAQWINTACKACFYYTCRAHSLRTLRTVCAQDKNISDLQRPYWFSWETSCAQRAHSAINHENQAICKWKAPKDRRHSPRTAIAKECALAGLVWFQPLFAESLNCSNSISIIVWIISWLLSHERIPLLCSITFLWLREREVLNTFGVVFFVERTV